MHPHPRQRGQATPIMAVFLVVAGVVALAVVAVGAHVAQTAHAQTAADAAALAGAASGQAEASRVAAANRGRLVAFRQVGDDVIVTVAVGSARAEARARASRIGDPAPARRRSPAADDPLHFHDGS
jgi:hypothetical protein